MKLLIQKVFFIALISNFALLHGMQGAQEYILPHAIDKYNGVIITIENRSEYFQDCLKQSLAHWKSEGKRGIWLNIPIEQAELIPIAVQEGFIYHHATTNKLVLTQWLAQDEENKLPNYATRTAGISALVIDDHNRILLVKEKYDNQWGYKMPSGAVEMGENFKDAAIRETKEETGIDTIFKGVVAWWERHNTRMDNVSDLFFLCRLHPLNTAIFAQESEVADALWMPFDEFKKIATGPQKEFIAAIEAKGKDYIAYEVPDFSGKGTMTYYAHPQAQIK